LKSLHVYILSFANILQSLAILFRNYTAWYSLAVKCADLWPTDIIHVFVGYINLYSVHCFQIIWSGYKTYCEKI